MRRWWSNEAGKVKFAGLFLIGKEERVLSFVGRRVSAQLVNAAINAGRVYGLDLNE